MECVNRMHLKYGWKGRKEDKKRDNREGRRDEKKALIL
jgi:hypothetical protein